MNNVEKAKRIIVLTSLASSDLDFERLATESTIGKYYIRSLELSDILAIHCPNKVDDRNYFIQKSRASFNNIWVTEDELNSIIDDIKNGYDI